MFVELVKVRAWRRHLLPNHVSVQASLPRDRNTTNSTTVWTLDQLDHENSQMTDRIHAHAGSLESGAEDTAIAEA